jgi:hypothetical protein
MFIVGIPEVIADKQTILLGLLNSVVESYFKADLLIVMLLFSVLRA